MTTESERGTLTIAETARILGIGRGLAYRLARSGELPGAIRLGNRLVVSRQAIRAFMDDNDRNPPGAAD
jgi:excisionase family DNA binding protein